MDTKRTITQQKEALNKLNHVMTLDPHGELDLLYMMDDNPKAHYYFHQWKQQLKLFTHTILSNDSKSIHINMIEISSTFSNVLINIYLKHPLLLNTEKNKINKYIKTLKRIKQLDICSERTIETLEFYVPLLIKEKLNMPAITIPQALNMVAEMTTIIFTYIGYFRSRADFDAIFKACVTLREVSELC